MAGTTGGYAEPLGDPSHYLYELTDPTTVTFTNAPVYNFLIDWGSIDAVSGDGRNNILTLSNGDSVTAQDLVGFFVPPVQGAGSQADLNDNKWFQISDTNSFTYFTATVSNGEAAFEFDMAAVPELSTWAMMLHGLRLPRLRRLSRLKQEPGRRLIGRVADGVSKAAGGGLLHFSPGVPPSAGRRWSAGFWARH